MAIISQKKSYKKIFRTKQSKHLPFSKEVNPEKLKCFHPFNLRKIPKEKVYGNILDSKKAFLD